MSYLESLEANELIETLGELAVYDNEHSERYVESYPEKFRAFSLDVVANSEKGLNDLNIEQVKKVVENKSDDAGLRRYALLQLNKENSKELKAMDKQQQIDLNGIFEDESEPVEVRTAAVTAMRKLEDPNFSIALEKMAKIQNMNDPMLRSFLTSAAHGNELDTYF